jgi:hypothetical protein
VVTYIGIALDIWILKQKSRFEEIKTSSKFSEKKKIGIREQEL